LQLLLLLLLHLVMIICRRLILRCQLP
jgi:hypothetical protein